MTASAVRERATDPAGPSAALRDRVWTALGTVGDPELDQSIVDRDFVTEVGIAGREVAVALRLPAYASAPNSAALIVAETHDAVAAITGVDRVTVELLDHAAAAEINAGVSEAAGVLPGQRGDRHPQHRVAFQRRAYRASLERACRMLLDRGWDGEELPCAQLFDLPDGRERASLLRRRDCLGLTTDPEAYLMCSPTGDRIPTARFPLQ